MRTANRLALGTVQFGLPYGVANTADVVSSKEAASIIGRARDAGLDTLDTAIAYGVSEERLGAIGVAGLRVVSKLPRVPPGCRDVGEWVRQTAQGSLERLRLPCLYGLLVHHPAELLGPHGRAIRGALENLKAAGLVERIGVSVYGPEDLDVLVPHFSPELVQAPYSLLDRRLATSGWLARLKDAGTEVHVRSIFLQGLLLMRQGTRPPAFEQWKSVWDGWHRWLDRNNTSALSACLGFALAPPEIDRVVVGVDNLAHFEGILQALSVLGSSGMSIPDELSATDLNLIDPTRWSARQ